MNVDPTQIQNGLLHFKRTMSNPSLSSCIDPASGVPGNHIFYLDNDATQGVPVNTAPPPTAPDVPLNHVLYLDDDATQGVPVDPVNTAPPPTALQSLQELVQNSYSNDAQMNQIINKWFTDAASPKSPVQLTGPLAVKADLALYENFLAIEAIRNGNDTLRIGFSGKFRDPVIINGKKPLSTAKLKSLADGDALLERNSTWHKGVALMELLILYFKKHFVERGAKVTFSQFVTLLTAEDLMQIWQARTADYTQECIRRFIQGVRYLTPQKAEKYNVTICGENLFWAKWGDTLPLDTTTDVFFERKHASPHLEEMDAAAIWILSKEDKLYTHPAKVHRFHHSSFTSGDLIRCGGDWEVKNGKLMWISALSGHYKPGVENLQNAVKVFANKFGINANNFKVKVFSKEKGQPKEILLPASKLLFDLKHIECKYRLSPY